MKIDILTLFPELCESVLDSSIIGRARKNGLIDVRCHNIRDYAPGKHRRVDDYPFGGGQGMLLAAEPLARCFEAVCAERACRPKLIYLSPLGRVFRQSIAIEYSQEDNGICLLCGHYEGVDERFVEEYVDEMLSIGDFVLTGGELPALAVADAVARMIPGVLSETASYEDESHMNGLLEYPQYTRPAVWREKSVPDVLLSGHEANIIKWRHEQSLERTARHRPDMLSCATLPKKDRDYLVGKGLIEEE